MRGDDELEFVRSVGYEGVFPERLALAEPWPITQAVVRQELVELRDVDERRVEFRVPEEVWGASGRGTLVAAPLLGRSGPVGALGFTRESRRSLTVRERRLVETLARQAALALDRARLFEAERDQRRQAEGLQRVASAVATSATVGGVADAVAREASAVLGVLGVTVLLSRDGSDEGAEALASCGRVEPHARSEPIVRLDAGTVTASAIRLDRSVFTESSAELEAGWPASFAVARRIGVEAVACVPIRVGARRGAISVVDSARRFSEEERRFLDLLARVCEQGILRAELYEAERDAHTRAELLQGLAAALSGALLPADVGVAFLNRALGHVGAASGALMLVEPDGETLVAAAVAGEGTLRRRWLASLPVSGAYLVSAAFREGALVRALTADELERLFPGTWLNMRGKAKASLALPLVVAGTTIGAFGLVFEEEPGFTTADERALASMADLCAQALERAPLYENQHRIALRLQSALLPDSVVRHPSVQVAARYEAASANMEVGGDWYDTFALPDGRVGLAVGDVVGHGIEAAASMGRLRSAFGALASDGSSPAELLSRLDRFIGGPDGVDFATACYAVLDPRTGTLEYASAGHPPMLTVSPSGQTAWLEEGRSGPLHPDSEDVRSQASVVIEPESLLLLYSDGLVEGRSGWINDGLARLEQAARALRTHPAQAICDLLLSEVRIGSNHSDDVVLVALRLTTADDAHFRHDFPAQPEQLSHLRHLLETWLAKQIVPTEARHDLILAISEACANAIEHAYANTAPGQVQVDIANNNDGQLTATIQDYGRWRPSQADHSGGRGTHIVRTLSQSMNTKTGPSGTTVTLQAQSHTAARA